MSTTFITTDKEVPSYEKRLSICLRPNGFSFSIRTLDGILLTVGDTDLPVCHLGESVKYVKDFFSERGMAAFGLKSMDLIVPSDSFVWIPEQLYDAARDRQYLKLVSRPDSSLGVYHDYSPLLKSYIVFTADATLVTAFKVALPGIDVRCQHSVLANAHLMGRSRQHPLIVLCVRDGKADISAYYNGQLLLSNTQSVATQEDVLYRALEAMKQLHLETPDMELSICGNVGREIYGLLQHYFPNVSLYTGAPLRFENPQFQTLHTYRHVLILS